MEFIDATGQPRRREELEEALKVVIGRRVDVAKGMKDPELFVQWGVIQDALKECIARR